MKGFAAVLGALACSASAGGPTRVDELGYLRSLQARRPGLMQQHAGSVDDPAWQALVIAPEYREAILGQSYATYLGVLAAEYSAAEMAADRAWALSLLEWGRTAGHGDVVPFADRGVYVGLRVGEQSRIAGDYTYKVFLGFADFRTQLSASTYAAFGAALSRHGFDGASKVDLREGATRFRYNQLVVYARSGAMAQCAERVAEDFFGATLEPSLTGGRPLDWHHFLLTGGYDQLPAEARAFVEYAAAPGGCPDGG
jgi:hypothetical protein